MIWVLHRIIDNNNTVCKAKYNLTCTHKHEVGNRGLAVGGGEVDVPQDVLVGHAQQQALVSQVHQTQAGEVVINVHFQAVKTKKVSKLLKRY